MNERKQLVADLKIIRDQLARPPKLFSADVLDRAIEALSEQGEPVATVHVVRRSHGVVDTATRFLNTDQFEDGLNNLYAHPQPLHGWVKCSERLPENGEECFIELPAPTEAAQDK